MALATTGLEMGAVSMMLYGLREREMIMDIFEGLTGLRMNHAYIRIGGVVMDLPEDGPRKIRELIDILPSRIDEYETLLNDNPIWRERNEGVGGAVGRALPRARRDRARRCARRASAVDLRKDMPYCGYETFDFDVPTRTEGDAYARYRVRIDEMRESLKIVEQALERLVDDPGSGDDRGPEGRLAVASVGRARRHRQRPRVPRSTSWRSRWRP